MLSGDSTILSHAIFWWYLKLQRYGQSHGARSNAGSFSLALHGGYLPSALRGANPRGSPRAPEDNRPLQPHRVALAISMGVVYLRSLSEKYNMNSDAGNNVAPVDDLDKLILDVLTKKYDNVIVTDWLLVCNSHLERLNNIRKAALEVITVNVGADLSLLSFFERISIKKTVAIRFPIEVYVNNQVTRLYFSGDVCEAYMPLEEWREKMPLMRQLLKFSYSTLSGYIGSRGCLI